MATGKIARKDIHAKVSPTRITQAEQRSNK